MQHRNLTQACTRVVAGMFIGVLMAAAPGAFADEVSSFNQNASFSTQDGSNPLSVPTSQNPSTAADMPPSNISVTTAVSPPDLTMTHDRFEALMKTDFSIQVLVELEYEDIYYEKFTSPVLLSVHRNRCDCRAATP